MKQLLIAILLCTYLHSTAQVLDIADPNFMAALVAEGVDDNFDGMIQVSEAEAIKDLDISGRDFLSIEGIEGFTNLQALTIGSNDFIDSIDLSIIPWLETFRVYSNRELTYVNVSGHPSLEEVIISGSSTGGITSIIELEITDMPKLEALFVVSNKSMTSLTLRDLGKLSELRLLSNTELVNVDLTDLTSLEILWLSGPEQSLSQVVLGTYPLLEVYHMGIRNPPVLDLTKFPTLKELSFTDPYGEIQNIEIFDHPTLETLLIENYFSLLKVECHNLPSLTTFRISSLTDELKKIVLDSLLAIEELSFSSINELSTLEITNANKLTQLVIEADKLSTLELKNLPVLTDLEITGNRIETLDLSTLTAMTSLELYSLSIKTLFIKNTTNENLYCGECEELVYICKDEDDTIQAIPSSAVVGTFCPYTSGGRKELSGQVLYNADGNGCDDTSSYPIPYHTIAIHQSGEEVGLVTANSVGEYLLYFAEDTLDLSAADNPINSQFLYNPDTISLIPNDTIYTITQDICVSPKELIQNLELILIDPIETRPGELADYKLKVRNIGTAIPQGILRLDFEGDYLTYNNSTPMAELKDSTAVEWPMPAILPFQEETYDLSLELNRPTDDFFPLDGGDSLQYIVSAQLAAPPLDTTISTTFYDVVVNSFDPNDKQCLQGKQIEQKDLRDYLYYMIRFENLGTADARNIVVQDTLEAESYIISTFQLIDASHEVYATLDDNVVSFVFEDINLGYEDDENDGYLMFKIKPQPGLEIGHKINNSGSIYFDYNFPIHTNIAETEIIDGISNNKTIEPWGKLDLYPTISSQYVYLKNHSMVDEVKIFDMQGVLISKAVMDQNQAIDISGLDTGVYLVRVQKENKMYAGKIIKI